MSRDEFETAKPRPAAVHNTSQHLNRSSYRSVRAGSSKPSGYDNPLYTTGDVLVERESDAGEVMPLVVGDHAVVTPRRPESPLVAKLKAQASDKSLRLRQDRILNSSVGVSPAFAAGNPAFPSSSLRSPRTPDRPLTKRNNHARPPRTPQTPSTTATTPRALAEDDADSVDSLVLDDGPNPVRVVTPGATARARAFGDFEPNSPNSSAALSGPLRKDGADTQAEGTGDAARPSSGASEGQEDAAGAVAPQESMPAIAAGAGGTARNTEARPSTPQRDRDLLSLLSSSLKQFVSTPGPVLEPLKCYILREKAPRGLLSKAPHVYKLYLEDGDQFLLSARRREHTKCPSYVISLDESVQSRRAMTYCGKTRSNFIGTEFQIFDAGERSAKRVAGPAIMRQGSFFGGQRHSFNASTLQQSASSAAMQGGGDGLPVRSNGAAAESRESSRTPSREGPSDGSAAGEKGDAEEWGGRTELGVVQYQMNVMGTKGPRKMLIGIPYVDLDTNESVKWSNEESMMPALKRGSDSDMIRLVNKVPKWNTALGAYCLNFNGRVTLASVKNFQLVAEKDEQEREVLQFGRVAEHRFTMDYAWPLTAYQAFCICITSLDSKLACE